MTARFQKGNKTIRDRSAHDNRYLRQALHSKVVSTEIEVSTIKYESFYHFNDIYPEQKLCSTII